MNYKTKQRETMMAFLESHPDDAFSAREIFTALSEQGISLSAIYRNLSSLEQEGRIREENVPGNRETHYRYVDSEHCRGHVHMRCVRCGKMTHLDEAGEKTLERALAESSFSLDAEGTVLYGCCKECGGKK